MLLRPYAALAALVLLAAGSASTHAEEKERTLRGKRVALEAPATHQLEGTAYGRAVENPIVLAGLEFASEVRGGRLHVATRPGAKAGQAVREGKPVRFTAGKKKLSLLFRQRDDGTWWCHAGWALRFKLDGTDIRFVDLNVDGTINEKDGILVHGSTVALPWATELALVTKRLTIRGLDVAGSSLTGVLEDLPGTALQHRALHALNAERARHGLGPAVLDAKLSAACTAHERYLLRNGWDGGGDPHRQDPKLPDASPEGAAAAARSVIAPETLDDAIRRFLTTYYHRIGPCHPDLDVLGMNAGAKGIAIVDVSLAYERRRADGDRWRDVICVPADGAVGVATYATGEKPKEPVPSLASRGSPLIVYFRERLPDVKDFKGALVRLKGRKREPVDTLLADQGVLPFAFGIVPASRLRDETWYEATFTYTYNGSADRRVVRFRTGVTPKRR